MNEGEVRMLATMYIYVAELHACAAEIEGMKAENQQRACCGQSPAYREDSFSLAAQRCTAIAEKLKGI